MVDFGCEIWGDVKGTDLEKLQLGVGRKILRGGRRLTGEVVRGELGWESHRARRDELRLRFWNHLLHLPGSRLARQIYEASRKRLDQEEAESKSRTSSWCVYTRDLLTELGLEKHWSAQSTLLDRGPGMASKWNDLVRAKLHQREEALWRKECLAS